MSIKKLIEQKSPLVSFEIFPPKPDMDVSVVYKTIDGLVDLNPDFISVTYGALGTTTGNTVEMASYIRNRHSKEALAHLTCVNAKRKDIDLVLEQLSSEGIENILALRGDIPDGQQTGDFKYASDLIEYVKSKGHFTIGAACYPEGHLESISPEQDILHMKMKADAGADFLITQLFLDNEMYYEYLNKLRRNNIDTPVIAGILPVLNKKQVQKIISLSGCSLPKKFKRILEKYENDDQALKQAGTAYAIDQIIDLLSWDVSGIHLYTMNKTETAREIINSIHLIRSHLRAQNRV